MRDQSMRTARAKNTLHSRAFPPPLSHGVPYIFLNALLSSVAVAFRLGLCDKFLRSGKLATSSLKKMTIRRLGSSASYKHRMILPLF